MECLEVGSEGVAGLAGEVAFEATEDFASVETLGGAFGGLLEAVHSQLRSRPMAIMWSNQS